jgi:hypothetical protein
VEAVTARSERSPRQGNSLLPRAREKTSAVFVPRSDTGALAAQAKVCRATTGVREFGKLVPYVRKKGCLPRNGAGCNNSDAPTV